ARVRELEAQLAEASGPVWKDLLAKDGKAKDAARTALREDEAERAALRDALLADDAMARRAARALFEGDDAPSELAGPALHAAVVGGDTGLLDAIGIDAALEPMTFLQVGGEEPATSTLLAWVAGRAATLTDEERTKAVKSVSGSASYDGPWAGSAWFHLRLLARLDAAAALATSPAPYDANTPIELIEAIARQGEGALPPGSGELALRALLVDDLAMRRAAAVVGRRAFGASFDVDPAADAATREKAVARLREGASR
ncbi:MAG: hypothetical protein KDB73_16400, partial [Planctomycetes bacterium]|nr:hypothetical protein [Planctomycetota bacterium]